MGGGRLFSEAWDRGRTRRSVSMEIKGKLWVEAQLQISGNTTTDRRSRISVSRSYRSRQVAGFKMSLVGRKRAGETGGRGSRGRLGCRLDVPSGMAGVLHYTDGEGVCFFGGVFWELRRAALFSRLRCYLDGKVAIWQKSRGS